MSFKRIVYSTGQIIVDLIAIFLISVLSNFLVGNTSITENMVFLSTLYTVFKVLLHFVVRNYKLYWVYQLTRNYIRLIFTSLISIIAVISVNNILYHFNLSDIKINILIVSSIIELCYLVLSRYAIKFVLNL